MCQFFSCIIRRDGVVLPCLDDNSHETTISSNKLKDDTLEDRNFVRVELIPQSVDDLVNAKTKKWKYIIDEHNTLPNWYCMEQEYFSNEVREEAKKYMRKHKKNLKRIVEIIKELDDAGANDTSSLCDVAFEDLIQNEFFKNDNWIVTSTRSFGSRGSKSITWSTSTQSTMSTTTSLSPKCLKGVK